MNPSRNVPEALRERLSEFVTSISSAAPGLVTGVVVTGSAIAGDWWPGTSDIDVVFVTSRTATAGEVEALTQLHAATISAGPIDGVYLTEDQLAAGPDAVDAAPQVVEGVFTTRQSGAQLTWITWREVETGIEATTTPEGGLVDWRPSERRFANAEAGAREFSRQNLHDYWAPLVSVVEEQIADRADDAEVNASTFKWIAFGPARLAATIETGQILSKTAAARYAADRWRAYKPMLDRAIAARAGAPETFTAADTRQALQLACQVIDTNPTGR